MTDDPNNNNNNLDINGDDSPGPVPRRPTPVAVRPQKRVQFPTLQELEKDIAPPGCTPISSSTNLATTATATCTDPEDFELESDQRQTPKTKLIHSSTSLEVEIDENDIKSDFASSCTSTSLTTADAASISTFVVSSQSKISNYRPPRLPPARRGSSVPAKRTVSTGPDGSCSVITSKTAGSTGPGACPSGSSRYLPSPKSILRNPLVSSKDTNSNFRRSTVKVISSGSVASTMPGSSKSVEGGPDDDGTEAIRNEIWENIGKSCVPLAAPAPSSQSGSKRMSRRDYRTPRTRSTQSSSTGTCHSENDMASIQSRVGKPSISTDILPPMMTVSRGGRCVKKQLPNLTSVLAELREKEVVFDRTSAIQALKARILRGEKVTHEEIKAVRNMTLPPHQRHLGYRLPWSKDLYCVKGLVHIPTPNKPTPGKNSFGTIEDLRIPFDDQFTMEHYGRRQYVLNLAGFQDDQISLYLEGKNRLVLRAERWDGVEGNVVTPVTVTETILLPPDLPADNLRIVRKPSGTTIIEESWRF